MKQEIIHQMSPYIYIYIYMYIYMVPPPPGTYLFDEFTGICSLVLVERSFLPVLDGQFMHWRGSQKVGPWGGGGVAYIYIYIKL